MPLLAGSPACGLELLWPPFAPAGFGRASGLSFGHLAGDECPLVALQVAEACVAQDVGRFPGRQIQPPPHRHHLCRRAESGFPRIFPPELFSRLAAGLAQLAGGEPLSGGVAGQPFRQGVRAARDWWLLYVVHPGEASMIGGLPLCRQFAGTPGAADTLTAGDDNSHNIVGMEGGDIITGGSASDKIYGDEGNDSITDNEDVPDLDVIWGDEGDDIKRV